MWRFRVFGAQPYLYAADWAAGFQDGGQPLPGFEQYLPVTARLLATGRGYVDCYDATIMLSNRAADLDRRWRDYQTWSRRRVDASSPVYIIYVGDAGPRLVAESEQLRKEMVALDRRCAAYAAMEADDQFIAFVRTARHA
jgi:hypothetical protein